MITDRDYLKHFKFKEYRVTVSEVEKRYGTFDIVSRKPTVAFVFTVAPSVPDSLIKDYIYRELEALFREEPANETESASDE